MLGTSALLLLYMVFIGRGLRIAMDRTDPFGTLLAVGITTTLALQTFVIVAGVTRLIPLTGVPLPLVSYGGTSQVATFVMLGLLLRDRRRGCARDRQIRRLGIGFVVLFALLFGQIAYVQVVAADRIANDPANAARQLIAEYDVQRGQILAADGTVLAESVDTGAEDALRYRRRYPQGDLFGQITGYYSPSSRAAGWSRR